jgi:eukaryotic-like serine/threonine-protein kinase
MSEWKCPAPSLRNLISSAAWARIEAVMGLQGQIRALFRVFLMFTVLVAVALISAITTIRLAIHGHQTAVPDLTGVSVEQAERKLNGLGLGLTVEDRLYSQYAANQIVSQVPASGTEIKTGQRVHVLVSLGPVQASVPNLVGTSVRAARISAMQRGLTVGDVAAIHAEGAEPDQVVAQDPPPENTTVRRPAVNLLVSLGPPPVAYLCPNFVGRSIVDVRQELAQQNLQVGPVTPVLDSARAANTILSQSPLPGSKVAPDTVFTFRVAQ